MLTFHNTLIILFTFLSALICAYSISKKKNKLLALTNRGLRHKLDNIKKETNKLCREIRHNLELEVSLREKLERYSELKEVTELLSSSLNLKDLLHFISEESFRIIGKSERLLLFLVDEKEQGLTLAASKSLNTDSKPKDKRGDVLDKWVLEERRPLLIPDIVNDPRFPVYRKKSSRQFKSMVSAPLMLEDRLLGILRLEAAGRNSYTPEDLHILCVIADISTVAVNNAFLYARTEELAIKDGLTGLYVHRYFKERLREELKRAARRERKFSLLMIDIDYFKHYNDKYGHAAGDVVLQHIASSLHKFADTGDFVARYGGEEFAILLTEESKARAARIADEIRKFIEKDTVALRGQKTHVTVSIGMAVYPTDAKSEEDLIRVADNRLYSAKEEGRNRVCFS